MADEGLRDRLARQGEDALGKLAQDLLENPLVNSAISRAFEARERAAQAQEAAMGALNLPSAADLERLTRRLQSMGRDEPGSGLDDRLSAIEAQLVKVAADVGSLSSALDAPPAPVPRE